MNLNLFCNFFELYNTVKKMTKLRQGIQGSILKHNSFHLTTASLQAYDTCVPWVIMICAGTSYTHQSIRARNFLNILWNTTTVCLHQSFQSCLHSVLSWSCLRRSTKQVIPIHPLPMVHNLVLITSSFCLLSKWKNNVILTNF